MKHARPRSAAAPAPRSAAASAPRSARVAFGAGALALLAAAAIAALAHRAALGAFYTTDDLILFERMRHLVAWPWTPWRLVSGRLYWLLAFPVFDTRALPWHVVNLALHALNAALVTAWALRLGVRPPAALLAGGLFGASATAMTVTWPMTSIGELLACACALAGLLALGATRPRGPLAWGAFALGLLCKEHVVLVPLAAVLGEPASARGARVRAALPALVIGAALWAYVLAAPRAIGTLQGEAYAFGFGPHVLGNLRSYAAWALDRAALLPPTALDADPGWAGLVALVALVVLAFSTPAAAAGLALFALALLPVLPLSHHTYVHYLYLPFAGWCVALAAVLERLAARWREGAAAWGAVAVALALATIACTSAIERAANVRTSDQALVRDPFVRRMNVARNAWTTLASGLPADAHALTIVRAAEARRAISALTGREVDVPPGRMPAYNLIAATLDDGRGLRALFPQLASVRFEDDALSPADTNAVLATPTPDGHLVIVGSGRRGAVALADLWIDVRLFHSSAALLRSGLRLWPGERELAWRLDSLVAHAGPAGP